MPAYETHIAILGEPPVAGILAVNAPDAVVVYHGHLRNFLGKFSELNKKRPREIVIHFVRFRVPFVAPPAFVAVNDKTGIGIKKRNNGFAAQVALAVIKNHIVFLGPTPLPAAFRTKRRWRNLDFLIKPEVLRLDGEALLAVLTDLY